MLDSLTPFQGISNDFDSISTDTILAQVDETQGTGTTKEGCQRPGGIIRQLVASKIEFGNGLVVAEHGNDGMSLLIADTGFWELDATGTDATNLLSISFAARLSERHRCLYGVDVAEKRPSLRLLLGTQTGVNVMELAFQEFNFIVPLLDRRCRGFNLLFHGDGGTIHFRHSLQ